MDALPPDILMAVFKYLDPEDLYLVPNVCRYWREVCTDAVWRHSFAQRWATTEIAPLVLENMKFSWRVEYYLRKRIIDLWGRRRVKGLTMNPIVGRVSCFFPNFDSMLVMAYNQDRATSSVVDLTAGRVVATFNRHASEAHNTASEMSCLDGCCQKSIHGYNSGEVTRIALRSPRLLKTKSHRKIDHTVLDYRHDGPVRCVWISKERQGNDNGSITCASGGIDGVLYLTGKSVSRPFKISQHSLERVACLQRTAAVLDKSGDLYVVNVHQHAFERSVACSKPGDLLRIASFNQHGVLPTEVDRCKLIVTKSYALVQFPSGIFRVLLDGLRAPQRLSFGVGFARPDGSRELITAFASETQSSPEQHFVACATNNNMIVIWSLDSRSQSIEGEITPLRVVPCPLVTIHSNHHEAKPSSTQCLAMNAAILVVAGLDGEMSVLDLLTGQTINQYNLKIPKHAINSTVERNVPIIQIELDKDNSMHPHGVFCLGPVIHYFSMGTTVSAKRMLAARKKAQANVSARKPVDLQHEIEDDLEYEFERLNDPIPQNFTLHDMTEEEQTTFALSMSREDQSADAEFNDAIRASMQGESDEELQRALELSLESAEPNGNTQDGNTQFLRDLETAVQNSLI